MIRNEEISFAYQTLSFSFHVQYNNLTLAHIDLHDNDTRIRKKEEEQNVVHKSRNQQINTAHRVTIRATDH